MLVASRISQRMLRYRDSAQACFCTTLVCVGRRKCFGDMCFGQQKQFVCSRPALFTFQAGHRLPNLHSLSGC